MLELTCYMRWYWSRHQPERCYQIVAEHLNLHQNPPMLRVELRQAVPFRTKMVRGLLRLELSMSVATNGLVHRGLA